MPCFTDGGGVKCLASSGLSHASSLQVNHEVYPPVLNGFSHKWLCSCLNMFSFLRLATF